MCLVFISIVSHANEVAISLFNNENPTINNDTMTFDTSILSTLDPTLQVKMAHRFQKFETVRTEFSEISLIGGSSDAFSYQLSHGFGQPSLYFSGSSIGVQLMKRLTRTNISGLYRYRQDSYSFGKYRQAELGSRYRWGGTTAEMGAGVENFGRSIALQYFVFASHQLKYVVGKVQAKLYVGPQYIVDDATVNAPEFGFRMKLNGQWLFLGMPSNIHLSYGVHGMLVKRTMGMYRRFGAKVGLVYLY